MKLQVHIRLFITALFLAISSFTYSVNRFWVYNAFGSAPWGNTANWSATSGGAGGASVPGAADVAIFDGNLGNGHCTVSLNVNISGFTVTSGYGGTISQGANTITVGANASFSGGTFTGGSAAITINGTFTLSGAAFTSTSSTLALAGTVTSTTGTFIHNSGTVSFNSTGSQTIPAWNYYNLTSTSTGTRTLSTGGIGIINIFTKGGNTYSVTGGTVEYKGTGAQTIASIGYNNLTISGARGGAAITLANSGTIGILGIFTITATNFTVVNTSSTVSYNGTGAQTVLTLNYNSLTITGAHTTNNITLASTGHNSNLISIEGIFTNSATFTTGTYVITGSTVDYNGTGSQAIIAFNYNNLTSSSSGARTLASTGIIRIAGTFTKGTNTYTNTGSVIDYNGSGAQTITAFNYNNLIISGARASNNITLANSGTIGIARVFNSFATFSSGFGFVTTGSTVDYNGTLPEAISAFQYENVTSSSTGERSFATTGTVKIANALNKGANTFVNNGINGEGFAPLYSKISTNVACCTAVDANTAFVAGDGGVILKTTDGGATWVAQNSTTAIGLRDIEFFDSNNGLAIGASGLVLRTANGGTTWASVTSGTTQTLSGIYYISSSAVLITCANGTIIKSVDGGSTWGTPIIVSPTSQVLYGMYFTDANTGYVVGNAGALYKTTNAGATWVSSNTGVALTNYLYNSVYFTDANTGYITGFFNTGSTYVGAIYKTTDAGANWILKNQPNGAAGSISFVNSTTGYLSGGDVANNTGSMLVTRDAGATWTTFNIGTYRLSGMEMINSNVGYVSGLNGDIIKITCCNDGGEVEFNGSITPVQVLGSTSNVKCNKLKINKPSGKVTLNIPFEVDKQLTFTTGIIGSSATNFLQLNATANAVLGASNSNFVTGPVKKVGNTLFEFPLGDELLSTGAYHPLTITAPTNIADAFTAEYKAANPITTYGSAIETDVVEDVSTCEYWILNRNTGTSVVVPYINWNTNSCNIVDFQDLLVAGWDGTKWKSLGNGGGNIYGSRGQIKAGSGLNLATLPLTIAKPNGAANGPYHIVKRQLDGGYAIVNNGKLCFKYDEEYADLDGKLIFNIYNDKNVIVSSNATMPLSLRPSVKYGDNRYMLNIASCLYTPTGNLGSGFYILEIINKKNEKWYLKFKNTISITGSCSESGTVWTQ